MSWGIIWPQLFSDMEETDYEYNRENIEACIVAPDR